MEFSIFNRNNVDYENNDNNNNINEFNPENNNYENEESLYDYLEDYMPSEMINIALQSHQQGNNNYPMREIDDMGYNNNQNNFNNNNNNQNNFNNNNNNQNNFNNNNNNQNNFNNNNNNQNNFNNNNKIILILMIFKKMIILTLINIY